IVQSYNPTNYAVQLAVAQDYDSFYEEEVGKRDDLGYPPFSQIINLIFLSKDRQVAEEGSTTLKKMLGGSRLAEKGLEILGPAPCPLPRVKNFYRWHIIIKMKGDGQEKNFIREVLSSFYRRKKEELRLVVDVDPVWIM
ncbi:primosomal protein N' (replication factor Y) (superfamily II helicase), partial [Candidatus Hakubella thermalkaliphila]